MKITPNTKICTLLDYIIKTGPISTYVDSYTKEDFLLDEPDFSSDKAHGINNHFTQVCMPSNVYISAAAKLLGAKLITNSVIYPEKGYMGWHTNSDLEGTRIYYTKTDGEAIFSYYKDGVRYNDYDNIGSWTCREFKVSKTDLLWHAIWTEKPRYAFGFLV